VSKLFDLLREKRATPVSTSRDNKRGGYPCERFI